MGREYEQDYCLASYRKAIIFKNSMSYRIKLRDSEYVNNFNKIGINWNILRYCEIENIWIRTLFFY